MKITVNFQSVPLIIVWKLSLSELLPAVLCTTVICTFTLTVLTGELGLGKLISRIKRLYGYLFSGVFVLQQGQLVFLWVLCCTFSLSFSLQCFDTVGWETGRTSGL